jgi:protein gp37
MASSRASIGWTDKTWNPTTGCTKVSPGCKNCYAEALTKRFKNHFGSGFAFTVHPERLDQPRHWRSPSRIFVNSMSDLFHEQMPLPYLRQIFEVMAACPQHVSQILTKRHERMLNLSGELVWPENVWMGVSVESQRYAHRTNYLRQVPAEVRFLSCEPLLGPLRLNLQGIHWVITGGESGPRCRRVDPGWVISIRDQCRRSDVAFFHKQWGGLTPKSGGRQLEGRTWDDMPVRWGGGRVSKTI